MALGRCVVFVVSGICIGLIAGYFFWHVEYSDVTSLINKSLVPIEEEGTKYSFIRPLLGYRLPEATLLGEYVSLKNSFQKIIDSAKDDGRAQRAAVYFRDLDAGRWVGINQDDAYHPASLLKVPTLIAYYKEAEEDPTTFSREITYDPSAVPNIPFLDPSTLVAGRGYSVENLLKYMITDSDNGATFMLLSHINENFLRAVYIALGIPDPGDDSTNYRVSARTYGLFFRVLYNTTYLSAEYSERALKLLSDATFKLGLAAGVPKGTVIAHKYGNHILSDVGGNVTGIELSDCGIVYYTKHSYLLCAMVGSGNAITASKIIADISRAAYSAVQERYSTTTPASL